MQPRVHGIYAAMQKTPGVDTQSVEQWIVRKIKNRSHAILQQNSVAAFFLVGREGFEPPLKRLWESIAGKNFGITAKFCWYSTNKND